MEKQKTQKQLLQEIFDTQVEHGRRLTSIETQAKYTNGKVAELMEDKIRRDERAKVLKELESKKLESKERDKNAWNDPKLVTTVIGTLIALTGFLIYITN